MDADVREERRVASLNEAPSPSASPRPQQQWHADWTRAVAALRRRQARMAAAADRAVLCPLSARRFGRGTNALYALEHSGMLYCAKLYTAPGERSAARESAALALLHRHDFPYAPTPVHFADAVNPHAVVMTRFAGTTMRHRRLTRPVLAALAETLAAMYCIGRDGAGAGAGGRPVALDHQKLTRFIFTRVRVRVLRPQGCCVRGRGSAVPTCRDGRLRLARVPGQTFRALQV